MKKTITLLAIAFYLNTNAQIITTVAGNGVGGFSGNGGQATAAELYYPQGVAIDTHGNIYIGDCDNSIVRKVSTNGIITTIAGNGVQGYSGDGGQATLAELSYPRGLAFDAAGNLYIAEAFNHTIRKVNSLGIISTIAGNNIGGYSGNGGQATAAELNKPNAVAFDAAGNLYIAEINNNCIRKVSTSGIISTIVGNTIGGYSGDGGQATAAEINTPAGLTVDGSGNIYIADNGNQLIRKVNTSGIISTIAGISGSGAYSGDGGQATNAEIYGPYGVTVDATGNLYIGDSFNNRVRKVTTSGIISTIAGNGFGGVGTGGYSGDGGAATAAELNYPSALVFDGANNLYIADEYNHAIRKIAHAGQGAGIEQFTTSNEQVNIYPNPTKDVLNIECSILKENSTLVITDVMGNNIKQIPFNTQRLTLNIIDLSEGIYNLSIISNEGVINQRLIVVH